MRKKGCTYKDSAKRCSWKKVAQGSRALPIYSESDSRRDGRVAEGGGLLNRYRVKSSIGGSNPPLSASESFSPNFGTFFGPKSPHLAAKSRILLNSENRFRRISRFRNAHFSASRLRSPIFRPKFLWVRDPSIAREVQWFSGKPEEYLSFGLQAAYLNLHGQRRESSEEYQRAAETARRQGLRYVADDFEEADVRADALAGNCQSTRRLGHPALALAMCGETAKAEKLAAETAKLFPNGTIWNAVQLPEIEAMIEPG